MFFIHKIGPRVGTTSLYDPANGWPPYIRNVNSGTVPNRVDKVHGDATGCHNLIIDLFLTIGSEDFFVEIVHLHTMGPLLPAEKAADTAPQRRAEALNWGQRWHT